MNTLPDLNTVPELDKIYKDLDMGHYFLYNFKDIIDDHVKYWYTLEPRGTEH